MSLLYNTFLDQCLASFAPCPSTTDGSPCSFDSQCDGNCRIANNCMCCLSNIFNDPDHKLRIYNCLPITYTYTLRYLNRYASEIYHILMQYNTLINQLDNKNIISIGCGPATELISLERVLRDSGVSQKCNYIGFDINPLWQNQNFYLSSLFTLDHLIPNPTFCTNCFTSVDPLLNETKLIILNYVVSDIYKHTPKTIMSKHNVNLFLNETMTSIFNAMPTDAYILINDANSRNMGRDEIENWAGSMSITFPDSKICKGYFDYPNRDDFIKFNSSSIGMPSNSLVFSNFNSLFSIWQSNVNECRSAFVLIKK